MAVFDQREGVPPTVLHGHGFAEAHAVNIHSSVFAPVLGKYDFANAPDMSYSFLDGCIVLGFALNLLLKGNAPLAVAIEDMGFGVAAVVSVALVEMSVYLHRSTNAFDVCYIEVGRVFLDFDSGSEFVIGNAVIDCVVKFHAFSFLLIKNRPQDTKKSESEKYIR